jgi:hypothetical protein
MAQTYMMTCPYSRHVWRSLQAWLEEQDCHKWVVAKETGRGGYRHIQARFAVAELEGERWEAFKRRFPEAHIEKASDTWEYERKEGRYLTSDDTKEIREQRFGALRPAQEGAIEALERTNDREVLVWYDKEGNQGKSWLCGHLYETGKACYVPPTIDTVKGLIQWVTSAYRGEPYIVIDIPRSWKWSEQLYCAIESIKDGLVYDTRYVSRIRNIRGVKVLVLTNTLPKLDKLSQDRWLIYETDGVAHWGTVRRAN